MAAIPVAVDAKNTASGFWFRVIGILQGAAFSDIEKQGPFIGLLPYLVQGGGTGGFKLAWGDGDSQSDVAGEFEELPS